MSDHGVMPGSELLRQITRFHRADLVAKMEIHGHVTPIL
jgi:hypothetical protein